ncbi:unnamed protein product [Symbiodinium necroappetens]|uniref:Uncharacterized protein n=2 Tax=Symbiodinium TaxID=2949 RepID=A0A812PYB2_9DINO|nr:hypothetical protein AK812_SmicGene11697 [Symbiodinium microadriaticum]CAE7367897.1 unnamed protein product [Symbiodinium necroappetens]CAE7866358.1 unnamed protein product [Symbiodinium microadriaticum]
MIGGVPMPDNGDDALGPVRQEEFALVPVKQELAGQAAEKNRKSKVRSRRAAGQLEALEEEKQKLAGAGGI